MEELFSSNLFAIYIIACITVISYTNFRENQRMFLLYLFAYATVFFQIFRISYSLALLLITTFVFLEYLTEDIKKLSLITKLRFKICDYIFMMIFQYHFIYVFCAFLILHLSHYNNFYTIQNLLQIVSAIPLWCGIHLSISQPFKIKSITEMCQVFEAFPPYEFDYQEKMQEKFDLLCAFEDRTYFQRKKSYSCVTFEFIKCSVKNHFSLGQNFFLVIGSILLHSPLTWFMSRGHSTPEMQLLRTIGIARGYDKYKIKRKIFEIVYGKIFFTSLKEYHQANTYLELEHYRHYLLYIYFQTVMTKLKGKKYTPLSSVFKNDKDISNWSMNGLFIACLGLSFRSISDFSLELFSNIIQEFSLDVDQIKKLNENYPEIKFPSEDR